MAKLSPKELAKWEKTRDFATEITRSVKQMKAGVAAREHHFDLPKIVEARNRAGLSQERFAALLGVSPRTLEGWEQGHRKPSGAARSLLTIAQRRPDVLRELFAK